MSGAALAFAFPEPDLAPLAWISIAPLLALGAGRGGRRGLLLGAAFGLGFFGTLLLWISLVGWIAWLLLTLLEAAFIGLFGAVWGAATRIMRGAGRLLLAPALWVAVEYFRASFPLGGFTWGQLAQSQHNLPWMLRPAALAGGWLVALLVVAVNALVAFGGSRLRAGDRRAALASAAGAVVVVALPLALPPARADGSPLRVALVQGNVPRDFAGTFFDKNMVILDNHVRLTEDLGTDAVDLVVWPESSVGEDYRRYPEVAASLERAARAVDAPIVVGANLDAGPGRYKVTALHVSPNGEVVDVYQKTHLVPFGEFVPGRRWLQWIPMLDQVPRDAIPADEPVVFDIGGGKVAPVISFEGDFGSLVRERIDAGARLLIVATNTSTWGNGWASAQHVALSQVRAAENGVWVAHGALSGISAFINPEGEIVERTELWTASSIRHELRFATGTSFYARTGDWLPLICLGASLGAVLSGLLAGDRARGGRR